MNNKEKKEWILKHWKLSKGNKISEMLKRYWNLKEVVGVTVEEARKIFLTGDELNQSSN